MFRLRSTIEVKKKIKRRIKKEKDRKQKELAANSDANGDEEGGQDLLLTDTTDESKPQISDLIEASAICKSSHKMKSMAIW